jgi:hypothetical protein
LLAAALVAASSSLGAHCSGRSDMTMPADQLDDTVMGFQSEGRFVLVTFSKLAGVYRLAVDRDDFVQQLGLLAGSYKSRKPVSLVLKTGTVERVSELRPR